MTRINHRSPPGDLAEEVGDSQTPILSIEGSSDLGETRSVEDQDTLQDGLGSLRISSRSPRRSSRHLLSPEVPRQSVEEESLVTIRDLANATPSPSPSPGPEVRSCPTDANNDPTIESLIDQTGTLDVNDRGEETLGVDELDLEDGDSFVQYDVNKEPLPPLPFSKRSYQDALKAGKALAGDVSSSLSRCDTTKDTTTHLYKLRCRAERLSKLDNPVSRKIGIVGDSAAGKSSLINSLLHVPDLALKGGHGSAVTSFVTEYRKRDSTHCAPFNIEVDYCTPGEIREQIHELLFSFRRLHTPGLDKDHSVTREENVEIERQSDIALSTLQSIFPGRPESQPEYLRGTWGGTSNLAFEDIEDTFQSLAMGLNWPAGADKKNGRWYSTAVTAEECRCKVAEFMEDGLWPLTNVVRIYLNAQVLRTGIVLADLPGYRDINLARVRKTERYMFSCDEIFIVANINRVVTDASVKNFMQAKLGPQLDVSNHICIVCTHADDISIPESESKWRFIANQAATKIAKREAVRNRRGLAGVKERTEMRYKYIYVAARNTAVKEQLSAKYPIDETKIFCIGNKDYDMEGEVSIDLKAREIMIPGSGIPGLRFYCHSLVDKAQFRACHNFLDVDIPDLVQSLEVWVTAAGQAAPSAISPICTKDLQKSLLTDVDGLHSALEDDLRTRIFDLLQARQEVFSQKATEVSEEWEGLHFTWVRHDGTHETKQGGFRRWNDELLRRMNQDLIIPWSDFLSFADGEGSSLRQGIKSKLDSLRKRLYDAEASNSLIAAFRLKTRNLIFLLQEDLSSLRQKLKAIYYDATNDHYSSLILTTMLPTYRACDMQSGSGMRKRMHIIMAEKMRQETIFPFIESTLERDIYSTVDEVTDGIRNNIAGMCSDIEQQIQTANGNEQAQASQYFPKDLDTVQLAATTAKENLHHLHEQASAAIAQAKELLYVE